ncbi:Fur-regulated basic protein FbpA [Fictibacillus phosphorivorans]|uniref:Fur-regulated basic protein FbpA n=1 Tax=Fictibacillus phosphorivorans TaxID=1221500 RepID=UPI001292CD4A|nr:Fur-regulated basic protein FbpA [Fictibacillus phosphorivorans]MQR94479.1 Fur-regulated basic protein FbpA [Fictibacillus phosphorivorans]
MGELIRQAIEERKKHLINTLLSKGIYKKNDQHLFQLTLSELEFEFRQILYDQMQSPNKQIL